MKRFLARFASKITGVVSGLDRLVVRGHLLRLIQPGGMLAFLCRNQVRLLDFGKYAEAVTARVKEASLAEARARRRPVRYLSSSGVSKEDTARRMLAEHPVREGLIGVLSAVEPCRSFEYHRSPDPEQRGLRLVTRKCLYLYHYYRHPQLGFLHARIQTWFPFSIQICLNGREWLHRQLLHAGQGNFVKRDNCFVRLGDVARAQELLEEQLRVNWPTLLDRIAGWLNPLHPEIFRVDPSAYRYFWSVHQSEWATD